MSTMVTGRAIGMPLDRVDGPLKVTGTARYAFEQPVDGPAYLFPLQATIAAGRIIAVEASAATAKPGVLVVLTHQNAPRLAWTGDPEAAVLYSDQVAFRGQLVGAVVAETSEIARHAAGLVKLDYQERAHDVVLGADRSDLRKPVNAAYFGAGGGELQNAMPADTVIGDVEAGLASAAIRLDQTYTTQMCHHNPMEPHTAVATWADDMLTLYCSSQGVTDAAGLIARVLGLDPQRVRAISPHVGGGFGSKVYPIAYAVLAALAAQAVPGRPVKFTLTRQQMFSPVGNRGPTIQRVQLGADTSGHLTAIAHDAVQQHARVNPRLLGVFGAGRIMNPKTARSQIIGGMTQGLSFALHEHSVTDPRFGHAYFLDEEDPHTNPMKSKGIGEISCVGTAAAIANAVHHATGIRVRDLPITLDKLL
jgi:xanthine dehydrogenase YagR molybdenum-binding subunit